MDQKPKLKVHLIDFKNKVKIGVIDDPKGSTDFWTRRIRAVCDFKYPPKKV